jgi:hypothetical protein
MDALTHSEYRRRHVTIDFAYLANGLVYVHLY